MENITLEKIAKATDGKLYADRLSKTKTINSVVIDSRNVKKGSLFVPIKGARVDGHDFIDKVIEDGAVCVLSEKKLTSDKKPYILVKSTTQALADIAEYYRSTLDIKVVGITGSVGKTSTKEMIASVLSRKYKVFKTKGNHNNLIGLSLMIFELDNSYDIAVLEMGISEFGEMHALSKIARPDVCVISNIGLCHMETLIDREGIMRAKTEMFDFIKPDSKIVLNGDDDLLCIIENIDGIKPIFFGVNNDCDIMADNIENLGLDGMEADIVWENNKIRVKIPVPGSHVVYNALAGTAVGYIFDVTDKQIKKGIETVSSISGRIKVINSEKLTVIDDCYNANPVSVESALDVLSKADTRKVAILGDMFELGKEECSLHARVGRYASQKDIDLLICIGKLSENIAYEAEKANKPDMEVIYFKTKEKFLEEIDKLIKRKDTVLVKASHGMGFDEIVNKLSF